MRASGIPLIFAVASIISSAASAQESAGTSASRLTVTGTLFDSVAGAPLRGATARFAALTDTASAGADSARTDAAGRYSLDVERGRYLATFTHPFLDSLGLEPLRRTVDLSTGAPRVDFTLPSGRTLAQLVCRATASAGAADSSALLMGHVRDAVRGEPLAGATVVASWLDVADLSSLQPREREVRAETTEQGWFAVCGVPADQTVLLRASNGADSSGYVRLTSDGAPLRHIPIRVGAALARREVVDSLGRARTQLVGPARLMGTVRDSLGRVVSGARASLWGTAIEATASSRGLFTLDSLPTGTYTLEVRAIGYEPVQRVVQLSAAQPVVADVRLTKGILSLPTVAVQARMSGNLRLRGFLERMRDAEVGHNHGYMITQEEIEKRSPAYITNMFDNVPGIYVNRHPLMPNMSIIRGPTRDLSGQRCKMTIYLDGQRVLPTLGGDEPDPIDVLVNVTSVVGMEVYPYASMAPPQYQSLNGGCGVILIWTK